MSPELLNFYLQYFNLYIHLISGAYFGLKVISLVLIAYRGEVLIQVWIAIQQESSELLDKKHDCCLQCMLIVFIPLNIISDTQPMYIDISVFPRNCDT